MSDPDKMDELRFSCSGKGALLYLPFPARRFDVIALGDFSMWIRKNIDRWFYFANGIDIGVEQMEDIILVTGCHLTSSWINVAFPGNRGPEQVSFGVNTFYGDGVRLRPGSEGGGQLKLGPSGHNLPENQCIFIRGYRVRRTRYMQLKVLTVSAMERPAPYSTSERRRARDFRDSHSDTTNDGGKDEDEGADTRTLTGRNESTPEPPDTHATAMSLSPAHAQRSPMSPQLELPPINSTAGPADGTRSHPNRLGKLRNYLRTLLDKFSTPEPDRDNSDATNDLGEDDDEGAETRTIIGRDESTPEPETHATALILSPSPDHTQRSPMSPQFELPSANNIAGPSSPADETGSAHSPHPNRLRRLRNYLHARQDKVSVPEPDRGSLISKDDVSVDNNDNEECDDRQEDSDLDDNQSSVYSLKTMAKRSHSTLSLVSTVSSRFSNLFS